MQGWQSGLLHHCFVQGALLVSRFLNLGPALSTNLTLPTVWFLVRNSSAFVISFLRALPGVDGQNITASIKACFCLGSLCFFWMLGLAVLLGFCPGSSWAIRPNPHKARRRLRQYHSAQDGEQARREREPQEGLPAERRAHAAWAASWTQWREANYVFHEALWN